MITWPSFLAPYVGQMTDMASDTTNDECLSVNMSPISRQISSSRVPASSPSRLSPSVAPRRSTQTTPVRLPSWSMVVIPSDSRKSVQSHSENPMASESEQSVLQVDRLTKKGKHKRVRNDSETEYEEQPESDASASGLVQLIVQKKASVKPRAKQSAKQSKSAKPRSSTSKRVKKSMVSLKDYQPENRSQSSPCVLKRKKVEVNLTQDSEDEHAKVKSKIDREDKKLYDSIKDYFKAAQ
ncbi:uncharacterized protein MELLADRAFT_79141, partial [Melampsora larici-populina 98AG31]